MRVKKRNLKRTHAPRVGVRQRRRGEEGAEADKIRGATEEVDDETFTAAVFVVHMTYLKKKKKGKKREHSEADRGVLWAFTQLCWGTIISRGEESREWKVGAPVQR